MLGPTQSAYREIDRSPLWLTMAAYVVGEPAATWSYGAPVASTSCTIGSFVIRSSCRRLPISKDWRRTLSRLESSPNRRSVRSIGSSSDRPIESKYVGCLVSGATPIVRPVRRSSRCTSRSTSVRVGISNRPSYAVFSAARGRSLARRALSSASVKSSVNHPVTARPSIVLVRPTSGELRVRRDVGGAADLVLVAGDEHAVLGRDQVGLDIVGAELDGESVGGEGVLGAVTRCTAVREHLGRGVVVAIVALVAVRLGGGDREDGNGERGGKGAEHDPSSHGPIAALRDERETSLR